MKIILLSNNENSKELYDWLINEGNEVFIFHNPLTLEIIDNYSPDFVISYNYIHIIDEDVIIKMDNKIINMHTSYLPWNRGSSPNIWSFIDDTPKGVTIHRIEKGLDTGRIIVQKQFDFDENIETLSSTYNKLNKEIVNLLKENWDIISKGEYELIEQVGKGSYHRVSDLDALLSGRHIDYKMTISEFKAFIRH